MDRIKRNPVTTAYLLLLAATMIIVYTAPLLQWQFVVITTVWFVGAMCSWSEVQYTQLKTVWVVLSTATFFLFLVSVVRFFELARIDYLLWTWILVGLLTLLVLIMMVRNLVQIRKRS